MPGAPVASTQRDLRRLNKARKLRLQGGIQDVAATSRFLQASLVSGNGNNQDQGEYISAVTAWIWQKLLQALTGDWVLT